MKRWATRLTALLAAGVAPVVGAQTLNFDEVCGAPPCNSGTAYQASWGVTVAPATTPIVAGGTNGLTGTNGARFLNVNTFPYQATITLPRTATFAAVDVSRSSLTGAGQTFTLQALNNGAPVGAPQAVTLGNVNAWTTVSVNVPGGFNALFLDSGGGIADRTFGVDNVRIAGNCAGFSDVAPSDGFCNAAEWLYNRGVTTGCTLGDYCPGGNVTRAQMALFMQRLGTALTPVELFTIDAFNGVDLDAAPLPVHCISDPYTVTGFPRTATANANLTAILSADADLTLALVYSTDGGTTWLPFPAITTAAGGQVPRILNASVIAGPLSLNVGSTYRFGLRLGRITQAGANTGDISAANCHLTATIDNRTTASAPFDQPASGASQIGR